MNKFGFNLVELVAGPEATVYTILKHGYFCNELRRFRQKDWVRECEEELERIDYLIFHTIPFEIGFHRDYFYPERSTKTGKTKIPKEDLSVDVGRLRLFCIRLSRQSAIFGNGGYKPHDETGQRTGTADFGDLNQYLSDIIEVYRRINDRINNGIIIVNSSTGQLSGNLNFRKY